MSEIAEVPRVALPGVDKGGAWVVMGDKQYKIAPLNFKALRELSDSVKDLTENAPSGMPSGVQMMAMAKIAHAALRRNYPDITEDEVADNLDFGNFSIVLAAVMGASGLSGREVAKPGETVATT